MYVYMIYFTFGLLCTIVITVLNLKFGNSCHVFLCQGLDASISTAPIYTRLLYSEIWDEVKAGVLQEFKLMNMLNRWFTSSHILLHNKRV